MYGITITDPGCVKLESLIKAERRVAFSVLGGQVMVDMDKEVNLNS